MKKHQLLSASALVLFSSFSDGYGNPGDLIIWETTKRFVSTGFVPTAIRQISRTLRQDAGIAVPRALPTVHQQETSSAVERVSSRSSALSSAATSPHSSDMHAMIKAESSPPRRSFRAYLHPDSNTVDASSAFIEKEPRGLTPWKMGGVTLSPVTPEKLLSSSVILQKSILLAAAREGLQTLSHGFIKVVSETSPAVFPVNSPFSSASFQTFLSTGMRVPPLRKIRAALGNSLLGKISHFTLNGQAHVRFYSTQTPQENEDWKTLINEFAFQYDDSLNVRAERLKKAILKGLIGEPRVILDASSSLSDMIQCVRKDCYSTFSDSNVLEVIGSELGSGLSKTALDLLVLAEEFQKNPTYFKSNMGKIDTYIGVSQIWDAYSGELDKKIVEMLLLANSSEKGAMWAKLKISLHNVKKLDFELANQIK